MDQEYRPGETAQGSREWGLGSAYVAELEAELDVVRSELEAVKEQLKAALVQVIAAQMIHEYGLRRDQCVPYLIIVPATFMLALLSCSCV